MKLLFYLRAIIMRILKPANGYWIASRSTRPLSRKFGFDRGTPIDRYWIESFLLENNSAIQGKVLEIVDNTYTMRFGHTITQSDVLDLNTKNKKATIYGNLKNVPTIKSNTYDCILLTQVLGMIDDYDKAIAECHRILKKGGKLIITSSCFAPLHSGLNDNYWRFTPASLKYVLRKKFKKVKVTSFGNVLTGQAFWVGMAQEELSVSELTYHDPYYPCLVGAICEK